MEKTVHESLRSHVVTLDDASGFRSRTARALRESWAPVDLLPLKETLLAPPIAEEDRKTPLVDAGGQMTCLMC